MSRSNISQTTPEAEPDFSIRGDKVETEKEGTGSLQSGLLLASDEGLSSRRGPDRDQVWSPPEFEFSGKRDRSNGRQERYVNRYDENRGSSPVYDNSRHGWWSSPVHSQRIDRYRETSRHHRNDTSIERSNRRGRHSSRDISPNRRDRSKGRTPSRRDKSRERRTNRRYRSGERRGSRHNGEDRSVERSPPRHSSPILKLNNGPEASRLSAASSTESQRNAYGGGLFRD